MNNRILAGTFVLALMGGRPPLPAAAQGSLGDGTFQDLDFESATVVFVDGSPPSIETGPALPRWTASLGGMQPISIDYNLLAAGNSAIALLGPNPPNPAGGPLDCFARWNFASGRHRLNPTDWSGAKWGKLYPISIRDLSVLSC
jgi:hypothetical protein